MTLMTATMSGVAVGVQVLPEPSVHVVGEKVGVLVGPGE